MNCFCPLAWFPKILETVQGFTIVCSPMYQTKRLVLQYRGFFPMALKQANENNMADKRLLLPSDVRNLVRRVSSQVWDFLGLGGRVLNIPLSSWVTIGRCSAR